MDEELIELERRGWQALSTSGAAASEFYGSVIDNCAAMALPGGVLIDDRAALLESMGGPPWSNFRLSSISVLRPTPDVGIVVYEASARRDGAAPYEALISSTYVRRADGWRLVFHQQTPH
ncbi:MAG TPA: nuclear transport factor 2 family protein [Micromonosporaceae bacterium]